MRIFGMRRGAEQGATALIIVIFSLLLFTIVTIGFMRTMTLDQQQSSESEQSRGAYDTALAAVEDGKRALTQCVVVGDSTACAAIDAHKCTTISDAGITTIDPATNETYVKGTSGGGTDYQQAYTCVKVYRNSAEYAGSLNADNSRIIPLSVQAGSSFDYVELSWFAPLAGQSTRAVTLPSPASTTSVIPTLASWNTAGQDRPPVMRAQIIQYTNNNVRLSDFDQNGGSQTLFLYPSSTGNTSASFGADGRRTGTQQPTFVKCTTTLIDRYYCHVTLTLSDTVGNDPAQAHADRRALLRLTSVYKDTDFRIKLLKSDGVTAVDMYDAQSIIDATGRAGNVFRRVRARVELSDPAADANLYPRATVDVTNNFCKMLFVTNNVNDMNTFESICKP